MPREWRLPLASAVLVLTTVWACEKKSPVEPTPPPACTFTLSTRSLSFGAVGGTASVTVTTGASCAWAAESDRGWMHVDSGASVTGPGTVTVTLSTNTSTSARTGTLTIAAQAVGVAQEGTPVCTVSVSPLSNSFTKDAASGTFSVTAPPPTRGSP